MEGREHTDFEQESLMNESFADFEDYDYEDNDLQKSSEVVGKQDPPIPMPGDRSFIDKKADENEMLLLPDNPAEGRVVTFLYTNEKNTTTSKWTYASVTKANGKDARWEKGVTKSTGGSWDKVHMLMCMKSIISN